MHKWILATCSALATACMLGAAPSYATPTTFFGEDLNGNANVRIAHPISDAARTSFFSNLSGVGTETFESFAAGSTTISPSFGAAGTATLSGGTIVSIPTGTDGVGRYPISG